MPVKDHFGKEYGSIKEMCAAWGVTPGTFRRRMRKQGMPLERALEKKPGTGRSVACTDHTGKTYASEKKMCEAWGVHPATYRSRIDKGLDTGRALTMGPEPAHNAHAQPATAADHEGREFKNVPAMCRHWNVVPATFRHRIRNGHTLKDALEKKSRIARHGSVEDHTGKKYGSMSAMCAEYGMSQSTVSKRLAKGYTLARALTEPVSETSILDPFGHAYGTYAALCAAMRLPPKYARTRAVRTPGQVAKTCSNYWSNRPCGQYENLKPIEFPWFLANDGRSDIVVHYKDIMAEYDAAETIGGK